jgi:hypothetical protein
LRPHMLLHILAVLAGQLFLQHCSASRQHTANLWLKEYLLIFHLFLLGVCNSLFLYDTIVTAIF